ncbi:HD domain-containing protein [uncultured Eudoraea sp.]|uniref:HD domain-containing protein n=1 Tax=uncultured Eudoraea sp. TaxID=1035614 RepID=UPI002624AA6B|nr:HD domain-containing protein [uncultured Eudoraea sp.]
MKGYYKLRKKALEVLHTKLADNLHYHGVSHTLDVLKVCNAYIKREGIPGHEAKLLRIGALLHDIGFTVSHENHEERGATIAQNMMTYYGFSKKDIAVVKGLIMSTKIPQTPSTKLEEIICDADLDYLGRSDFEQISQKLYEELKSLSLITDKSEWNRTQIRFLEAHTYHTEFAKRNRRPSKKERIKELKKLLASS